MTILSTPAMGGAVLRGRSLLRPVRAGREPMGCHAISGRGNPAMPSGRAAITSYVGLGGWLLRMREPAARLPLARELTIQRPGRSPLIPTRSGLRITWRRYENQHSILALPIPT